MSRDDHLCWYHGKLSRENAEELIKQGNENGTFLVRESSTAMGDFVLTLLYDGQVCHYQIRRHGEDAFFSIDDKIKILHGLDTLVDFYQQAANGLVTKLTVPLKKDPPPHNTRSHGVTNLLHRATKHSQMTVVSELLKCGYRNFDAKNQDGQTALHLAALHADEVILQLLLDAGVNVNSMDSFGYQPLHYAARDKPGSFIRVLIKANANVQGRNINNGHVPLHEAAKHGNLEAVKALLDAYAPHLPRTNAGEFPFDLANEAGHTEVENYLLNYKLAAASTTPAQWHHGTLSRDEAIKLVNKFAADMEAAATAEGQTIDTSGCFLVRYSDSRAGAGNVLTLLFNKQIKNFRIVQAGLFQNKSTAEQSNVRKFYYIDDGPYWPTLEHLIEHFMRFSYGLPVSLKYPVPPKPKPQPPSFATMPRSRKNSGNAISETSLIHQTTPTNANRKHSQSLSTPTHTVGDKHVQTLQAVKKKPKENNSPLFNTLKLRSPKKGLLSMESLRKSKSKNKSNDTKGAAVLSCEDELKKAEPLLKALSFSTDFTNFHVDGEKVPAPPQQDTDFYKVPMNNSPLSNGDNLSALEITAKTDTEVEYFTQSDLTIESERTLPQYPKPNANGYLPTVDFRLFLEPTIGEDPNVKEMSAAELREFSKHPERLDSFISTVSTESEMARFLNRQNSSASQFSTTTETIKLNCFIPTECLELGSIIGEGEFGSVHTGVLRKRNNETGQEYRCEVAIKTLRDEHCRSNKQEFLREASVMIGLQHHCIVQLIGISKGDTLMMVQELVPLGSMLNYILNNRDKINPNYELKLWASQIACGMEYLESHHFVHRDLAARNILLASRNQAKISDFGLSRALGSGTECYQATQGGKWPIKWYAPESFTYGIFSHASDVWSFGVTLWEMFSFGEPPYGDIRGVEAIELIESGQRLPQPPHCSDAIYEMMKNCWNIQPKDRPTFKYLTEFFVRDPNYQNLVELVKTVHIN